MKTRTWVIIAVISLVVLGLGTLFTVKYFDKSADGMFFEVKCLFANEDANYSLIVDDKKSAKAFQKAMLNPENINDRADSCEFITFKSATEQTLFVYSVMTVLKDVTFAFKEETISKNFYQVQYFRSDDSIAALSCNYENDRYDCYDSLPDDGICPDNATDAKKILGDKCTHN